jgi:hypothetical protein
MNIFLSKGAVESLCGKGISDELQKVVDEVHFNGT